MIMAQIMAAQIVALSTAAPSTPLPPRENFDGMTLGPYTVKRVRRMPVTECLTILGVTKVSLAIAIPPFDNFLSPIFLESRS